jgi:hypothetical protein
VPSYYLQLVVVEVGKMRPAPLPVGKVVAQVVVVHVMVIQVIQN